jgi:hypothetical protein
VTAPQRTDDDLRDQLAAVLWGRGMDATANADALLPAVRAYAAQQLREIAREAMPHGGVWAVPAARLRARADALEAQP